MSTGTPTGDDTGTGVAAGGGSPGTTPPQGEVATTTRWSPRELAEQLFGVWPPLREVWPFAEGAPLHEMGRAVGIPIRVEQVKDGDELVVRAELPGVDPEKDVEITVDGDVLTIGAQRTERSEEKERGSYRSEFRYGRFERQIRLPRGASPDVVSATYRDGVLEVRLPAPAETPEPRRIDVRRA